jgi:hypothetical protein
VLIGNFASLKDLTVATIGAGGSGGIAIKGRGAKGGNAVVCGGGIAIGGDDGDYRRGYGEDDE